MRSIAIVAPSPVPFQSGGAEKSFWALHEALGNLPGCLVELIKLPSPESDFAQLINSYECFSKLDLTHFDQIISCKYPAWMVPHPCHTVYMYHTLRACYDCYPSPYELCLGDIPAKLRDLIALVRKPNPSRDDLGDCFALSRRALAEKSLPSTLFRLPSPLVREVIHFLDRIALAPGQIKKYFALSGTVARREAYFPKGVVVDVLHLPTHLSLCPGADGSYFFTASRINKLKRIDLLIDAMAYVQGDIPLKIAGVGSDLEELRSRASNDARVQFLGHVSDAELAKLYAGALAVPFVPFDEDYGLITVEALQSGKPVVTVNDSGGVLELVKSEFNGLVTSPTPQALGLALDRLARDRELVRSLSENARCSVAHLNWPHVAARLAAAPDQSQPEILVIAPFPPDAAGSGGQRRLWHICQQLSRAFSVKVVCMGSLTQELPEASVQSPSWQQLSCPWGPTVAEEVRRFFAASGTGGDDLILARYAHENTALLDALRSRGKKAAGVVCTHPWLHDAITKTLPGLPIVYDAQNVEADLKGAMFGAAVEAEVAALEQRVCTAAKQIFACSEEDMQRFAERYGVRRDKLRLLANGCEIPDRDGDKRALRGRLPYPKATLAVFTGSGHKPNVEAALAITAIAREVPQVNFLIAGSVCGEEPLASQTLPPNVHLLGLVSEKVKNLLLATADLALNPMKTGSGTNLKTVEYLAWGLPLVSTPCGMRGVMGEFPDTVKVCSLEDFPKAILAFIASPPTPQQLMHTALSIQNKYSWSAVLTDFCGTLHQTLDCAHAFNN